MSSVTGRKHILVVEDEEHLASGIKYNLDAEGYRVTTVGDGRSALKLIEQDPEDVDLVVLDLMLPGMSGYAVCEALRAAERHMPVLILSARTLSEDRTRGFDAGADQYEIACAFLALRDEYPDAIHRYILTHQTRTPA